MIKFYYDTNNRYELYNNGYLNVLTDMDDNTELERFTDTVAHAIYYIENKYRIRLHRFN